MFINNFDPVAIQIFSVEIRWYSLAYITGIILGWILSKKFFLSNIQLKEKFDDYITYLIIGIIIGGRLGYVFIYNFNYYSNNIFDIIKIWQGGMSFHGGLIGVVVASILFAKKYNHNPFNYLDIVSIVAPIGIFLGRIANFINSELYGIETNLPWAVKFVKVDNLYRHPSQLYEALFETFWDEPWFAGGFCWKWFHDHGRTISEENNRFTPQGKPAEEVMKTWYGKGK